MPSDPGEPDITASQSETQSSPEGAKKSRRARGEQTRLKILEATLRVIADNGLAAVTHRAVAKEAEVSLSLTTYYFKDLQELLLEAFAYHKNILHDEIVLKVGGVLTKVAQYSPEQLQSDEHREQLISQIIDDMVDYVEECLDNPQGTRVEMAFFFDLHLPESFRRFAYEQRQRILKPLVGFYSLIGSETPEIDADILAGTVQRLQYEALAVPDAFDTGRIRQEIARVVMALGTEMSQLR